MKKIALASVMSMLVIGIAVAQDDHEFITIMDFEGQNTPSISASWDFFTGFTIPGEPVHSGEYALILDIAGGTAQWQFSTWQFPDHVGTLDLSGTDEMNVWVNATAPFRMNWEFGGANLGYRHYTEDDIGEWKKLAWWYPEETAAAFSEVNSWGSFINPTEDFTGIIYMDDIEARVRKESPEREYFLLNGFNSEADLENVTFPDEFEGGIITEGDVTPTEGDGFLFVTLSDANNDRFTFDISDIPEVAQYERVHFDLYLDGTASGGWGNFGLAADTTTLDADGNEVNESMTLVNGSYTSVATEQWHTFVQQYGPVEGTDGFPFQTLRADVIEPIYQSDDASIALRLSTNGGGVDGLRLYVDNLRLSRAAGTGIQSWEIF